MTSRGVAAEPAEDWLDVILKVEPLRSAGFFCRRDWPDLAEQSGEQESGSVHRERLGRMANHASTNLD
jgi:hypothetical protein